MHLATSIVLPPPIEIILLHFIVLNKSIPFFISSYLGLEVKSLNIVILEFIFFNLYFPPQITIYLFLLYLIIS